MLLQGRSLPRPRTLPLALPITDDTNTSGPTIAILDTISSISSVWSPPSRRNRRRLALRPSSLRVFPLPAPSSPSLGLLFSLLSVFVVSTSFHPFHFS